MYLGLMESSDEAGSLHPKWDGGVDGRGVKHKGVWFGLAKYADDNQIDPVAWVSSLFDMSHVIGRMPWPTDLKREDVLRHLRSGQSIAIEDKVHQIRAERLWVVREVTLRVGLNKLAPKDAQAAVLIDASSPLSDFSRYVSAVIFGRLDVAFRYFFTARSQYLTCPEAYDRAFEKGTQANLAVAALREVAS
jgi:hypothetical protein